MKKQFKEELLEDIDEIQKLFTDKISELHDVKGGQSDRHCFILYRKLINELDWKIREEK